MSDLNRSIARCLVDFQLTCGFGYPSFSNSSLLSRSYGAKIALPLTSFNSGTPRPSQSQAWCSSVDRDGKRLTLPDVFAIRVVLLRLGHWIENSVARFPALCIVREVPVNQRLSKISLSSPVVKKQIAIQITGNIHAQSVVHVSLCIQLPHAGINEWLASRSLWGLLVDRPVLWDVWLLPCTTSPIPLHRPPISRNQISDFVGDS